MYMNVTSDAALALGMAWDSLGSVQKAYYTPASKVLQFPLSMGTSWTSNTTLSASAGSINLENNYVVDGEGTLIIPGGQSVAVLRVKNLMVMDLGILKDTTTTYSFYAKSQREVATIIAPKTIFGFPIPGSISYSSLDQGSVGEQKNNIFTLLPNTPNPFAGQTTISYMLHKDANVKVVVCDQLGKAIATLADGFAFAGRQSVNFDAKQLPSGTYYYTVTAEGKSLTMPMTVTK